MTSARRDPREAAAQLSVDETGQRDGPTIMLLHGGNLAGIMWTPQRALLDECRLIIPDMPGYGASHELAWHSIDDMVEVLAAWLRERALDPVHIVGMSLGAAVAALLVARHPALAASGLIAGAPFHGLGPAMRFAAGAQLRVWRYATLGAVFARATHIPNEAMREAVEAGVGMRPGSAARIVSQVRRGAEPLLHELDGCPVPLLGVCGSLESPVVKNAMAELARANDARFALAPGRHHIWNYENPALFADMIRDWVTAGRVHDDLVRVRLREDAR